jgi:ABC-type antimicrobial peptide transport system permease subunit
MVSLTCEERRKEIAIRKINGAAIKDILDIFFKEHLILLIIRSINSISHWTVFNELIA